MKQLLENLIKQLLAKEWKLVTAESCTGGGLAYTLTSLAGSSAWFDRGFVTYSNYSKEELIHVNHETLLHFGAVSAETASEMAQGALENSQAQVSISITGIAGPDGGSLAKPIGTVWFGLRSIDKPLETVKSIFSGDRIHIREQAIEKALELLMGYIDLVNNPS